MRTKGYKKKRLKIQIRLLIKEYIKVPSMRLRRNLKKGMIQMQNREIKHE